jgi:hypothetical protein
MPWWDRDDEPETRSLSGRMWSTADKKPKGGNARMWSTSAGPGNLNLRINPRPRPTTDPVEALRDRLRRLRQDSGDGEDRNPRTNRWTAPFKAAPLPGTVKEARERAQETRRANRFRPGNSRITDQVARRRGGFQSTGGTARGGFKRLTAIQNGKRGGRPRTKLTTGVLDEAPSTVTDQVRNRGRFTTETARQAGSRSTPAKTRAAQVNSRRPRKRTVG